MKEHYVSKRYKKVVWIEEKHWCLCEACQRAKQLLAELDQPQGKEPCPQCGKLGICNDCFEKAQAEIEAERKADGQ